MNGIKQLLKEVSLINQKYEQIAKITGENFNVFQILGLQSDEVRLHSSFLAELLNPKGSHGQGDLYLYLFIKQLKLIKEDNFDTLSAQAFVEYHTIKITEDGENGGRIDILIKDNNGRHIIIENKIYAGDQPKQLSRYNKFDPSAILLYLNLNGTDPSTESVGNLAKGEHYHIISYKTEILEWLILCMKESTTLPIIRETIHQYINLIKKLTNQTMFNAMNEEIKDILSQNKDYFNNVSKINDAFETLKSEIRDNFFMLFQKKLNSETDKYQIEIPNYQEYVIQLHTGELNDGVFMAFRIAKQGNIIRFRFKDKVSSDTTEKQILTRNKDKVQFEKIEDACKTKLQALKSSDWSVCVYKPRIFNGKQLHEMDDFHRYISLKGDAGCNLLINELLSEATEYIDKIREGLKSLSSTK